MKKKNILIILIILLPISLFSAEWTSDLLTESTAIELLNYVQFSVSKIINSCNKGLLEDEFSGVLNYISSASLQDKNIIAVYKSLLEKISELKLSENEKVRLQEKQQEQRKAAIFNVFNTPGSILAGKSIVNIAYAVLNASFNYARVVQEIDANKKEAEFLIGQQEISSLDSIRTELYQGSAQFFSGKTNTAIGLISEMEMKDFAKAANIVNLGSLEEIKTNLPSLESKEKTFNAFPPYWSTRGEAYMKLGDNDSALKCFDIFESIVNGTNIFKQNPYLVSVAKNRISIMMKQESQDYNLINRYAQLIIENTPNVKRNLEDMHYFLSTVYTYSQDDDNALKSMNYLINSGLEKIPNKGLFATYIFSECDEANEGLEAQIFLNLISNISFGYDDDEIEQFLKQNKINPKQFVFILSSIPMISATTVSKKGKESEVLFHSYDMTNQKKMYVFDKVKWSSILKDNVYLDLTFSVMDYSVSVNCQYVEQIVDGDFSKNVIIDPTFWEGLWPGNWGDKMSSMISVSLKNMVKQ